MEQTCIELVALDTRVGKLEARAMELEKELLVCASQLCVVESKYLLIYDEMETLKQQLAMSVSCNGETKWRLSNVIQDVLGYLIALHSKAVKSQNTARKPFCGSLALLGQRVQTVLQRLLQFLSLLTITGVKH